MRRYKEISKKIKEDNIERYSTARYPFIPYRDSDIYIIGRSRQRLDILAYEYYNDPGLWWIIAEVNNIGKGTLTIPVNKRIRIPNPLSQSEINELIKSING